MQHRRSLFKTKKRYNEIIEKRDFHKNLLKKLLKKKNEKKEKVEKVDDESHYKDMKGVSFYIFNVKNNLRKKVFKMIRGQLFKNFIIITILVSTVSLCY